ncbi:hypothetical protein AS850_05120 [Frondihabitans sp. 762G35]|uniref:hypothetical protein n=1 Tax=Frondihabitans sp. 762G35 TaxID=1446794 RepID=UPI000D2166FA|nr:hypothetical protein [Frondihabitans sp. 762G35]ARC56453.1 hypothetical protein AS850_05120 [Frondihabitans sp. 762G35]
MQLGTRWPVGGAKPDRLPAEVQAAVDDVERELRDEGVDASTWRWTLTWLERKPVVELDDGTVIRQDASGAVVVSAPVDDDVDLDG